MRPLRLSEVAEVAGGRLLDLDRAGEEVASVASLDSATSADLAFCRRSAARRLAVVRPMACLLPQALADKAQAGVARIVCEDPDIAWARVLAAMWQQREAFARTDDGRSVAPGAWVAADAQVAPDARVEPGAVIGAGAQVGARATIGAAAVIGRGVVIGDDCFIAPGATIRAAFVGARSVILAGARVGEPGFGFAGGFGKERVRLPQLGCVRIGEDVEIGPNSVISCGALDDTIIGDGVKIDALCIIAHNVALGARVLIAAQAGIAGSAKVGEDAVLAARVGIKENVEVGRGAILLGGAEITRRIPEGTMWMSTFAAAPHKEWLRFLRALRRLTREKPAAAKPAAAKPDDSAS